MHSSKSSRFYNAVIKRLWYAALNRSMFIVRRENRNYSTKTKWLLPITSFCTCFKSVTMLCACLYRFIPVTLPGCTWQSITSNVGPLVLYCLHARMHLSQFQLLQYNRIMSQQSLIVAVLFKSFKFLDIQFPNFTFFILHNAYCWITSTLERKLNQEDNSIIFLLYEF